MMKFNSIAFLAQTIPSGGGATGLTVVQAPDQTEEESNTVAQVTLSAVGSGNHLIAALRAPTSAGAPTMSDSAGNTWGTNVYSYAEAQNGTTQWYFILANVTGSPTWVRATYAGSYEMALGVVEVSGGTPSVDVSNGLANSNTTDWGFSFTSTEDNTLFMGFGSLSNSSTATGTSPIDADGTASYFFYARGLIPTAGSNVAQVTLSDGRLGYKSFVVIKG